MSDTFDRVLASGGDAGALIASIDWKSHPLGPIAGWPQSLKTALSICLASRTPILVWWGPELFEFYNDAYRPVLGATKHPRAMGARGAEIWPEIWHIMRPIFESVLAGGPAIGHQDMFMFLDRNGFAEETFFDHAHAPVFGERGEIAGIFTTVTETTGKVLGERRLLTLKRLAEHTAGARVPARVFDEAVRVLCGNSADVPYAALFAGATLALTAQAGVAASSVPQLTAAGPALQRVLEQGQPELIELALDLEDDELSRSQQRQAPRRAIALPIAGSEREHAAAVLVLGLSPHLAFDDRYRDFVKLAAGQLAASLASAQTYEAQQRRLAALEELDRAKTHFFHNVSHEFRTPLTLMLGPTEDALARPEQALSGASLQAVHRNVLRLLRLVNMLLDFSRLEAGRLEPHFSAADLAQLTTDSASAFESAFERGGVAFHVECSPLAEAVWVDRELWEKIVLNLLSNALKFTFEGEVRVRLSEQGGRARLQVIDTGTGIPSSELPRLFERFHRVPGARARSHEGTGIGLALSHELVLLHGGTMTVESELGRGSVFTIELPFGRAHLPVSQLMAADAIGGKGPSAEARYFRTDLDAPGEPASTPLPASGELPRVLIADDNADMRDYLVRVLRPHFRVLASKDGAEALALARAELPDVVLSDVMMPELGGFELLRELRADPITGSVPFVLLSARAGEDARAEGMESGADDYVIKPFSARELIARVAAQVALGRARLEARRAQENLRAIFQQAPVAVSVVRGRDLTFELANPRYEEMVGRHGLVGRRFRDVFPELPADAPVLAMLDGVLRDHQPFTANEYVVPLDRRGDGKLADAFFMFACQPLAEIDSGGDAILTVAIDVTEQVALRREIEALSKERERLLSQEQRARGVAESASRVKDEFLAMLGHELRNPLAPITTALALLRQRGPLAKEQLIIERQVGHLTRLVDDLLDVSRITRGKVELKRQPVEIGHVVRHAVELASPLLEERRHHLRLDMPDGELQVLGDPTRLAQVLANLLTNAAKYTDPGGHIRVRVSADDESIAIAVSDDGIGIEPAMLEHIFDMFAQETQAIDRSNGGLGLGLTIVRNLVELHGGSVAAHSGGKGQGSEFSLRFPRHQRDAEAEPVTSVRNSQLPAATFLLRRVLVVDDNEDAADLLAEWFRKHGAEVRVAHDGLAALAEAQRFQPEIGVVDLGLPALSGYEVARRLRAGGERRELILVAVTGYGQESDHAKSAAAGFDAHCVKPLDLAAFEPLLAELVARRPR